MIRKRTQGRECALQILYLIELNPQTVDEAMESFFEKNPDMNDEAKQFARVIVDGTIKHAKELDEVIQKAADNWQMGRMAVIDRNILRFAVYELLYVEDIPPKVTINEAVNMAKKFSQEDSGKFVNGVLDKITHSEATRY